MFVKVLGPLRHDGERYKAGDVVELDAKQAAILIADGIAEKTAKPAKSTKVDKSEQSTGDISDTSADQTSSSNDQEPTDDKQESGNDEATGAE